MATKVQPEGATVLYSYQQKSLSVCTRALDILPKLAGAMPKIWFGPDYAVVVWGGMPSRRDLDGLARHLPVHNKIVRLQNHRVAAGETWDLTVQGKAHWPELDHLEELYVFLHIDHLVLERGARVVVQGNVMAIECGTLERAVAVNGHVPFGNGGDGGDGGNGGNGGNGGISSNIFVQLRPEDCADVRVLSLPSTGGAPGRGGVGGIGGAGGAGCASPVGSPGGTNGVAGKDGASGVAGRAGRGRPGARVFIVSASSERQQRT